VWDRGPPPFWRLLGAGSRFLGLCPARSCVECGPSYGRALVAADIAQAPLAHSKKGTYPRTWQVMNPRHRGGDGWAGLAHLFRSFPRKHLRTRRQHPPYVAKVWTPDFAGVTAPRCSPTPSPGSARTLAGHPRPSRAPMVLVGEAFPGKLDQGSILPSDKRCGALNSYWECLAPTN
jgi:hypothetical protein